MPSRFATRGTLCPNGTSMNTERSHRSTSSSRWRNNPSTTRTPSRGRETADASAWRSYESSQKPSEESRPSRCQPSGHRPPRQRGRQPQLALPARQSWEDCLSDSRSRVPRRGDSAMVSCRTRPEPWCRLPLGRAGVRRQSWIVAADAEIASAGRLLNHSDIQIGEVCDMDGGPVLVTRAQRGSGRRRRCVVRRRVGWECPHRRHRRCQAR